jgi:serine/threonine protein kinase
MVFESYEIVTELSPARSFLAHDPAGRSVVLKLLPNDCLLEGRLNPNIADRLRRVREIAMTNVANLRGVERDRDRAFLVWDFVQGVSFDTFAADPNRTSDDAVRLVRELIHTVEHFHSTGLVHGALHSGNVLVDSTGRIMLIDVSPLLYLDAKRDERAVLEMCRKLVNLRRDADSPLAAAVIAAGETDAPMATLSARLSVSNAKPSAPLSRSRIRLRSLLAAMIVIVVGAGMAIAINRVVRRSEPTLMTPPRVMK